MREYVPRANQIHPPRNLCPGSEGGPVSPATFLHMALPNPLGKVGEDQNPRLQATD
jgi:hypothetical protein